MQATVSEFDPGNASGVLVTDEGIMVPFDAAAFATSGLQRLRPGQRVTVEVEDRGTRAVALRLENVAVVPDPDPRR